jgi:hypothetical protein
MPTIVEGGGWSNQRSDKNVHYRPHNSTSTPPTSSCYEAVEWGLQYPTIGPRYIADHSLKYALNFMYYLLLMVLSPVWALDASLNFLILYTVDRPPQTGDQPDARSLLTQDNTNTETTHTNFHFSSGIQTHDLSVWTGEDISCLRPPDTVIG